MLNIKIGDKVYISGTVNYGDKDYRVASEGIVECIYKKQMLINIDMINGDTNACCLVNKDIIHEINY